MKPKTFMLIAGEASGDLLAAELVAALREQSSILHPRRCSSTAGGFTNRRNGCKK
ncbi:MAG TPA: hypothetical protein VFC17_08260 [Candidatus Limnocylindrales bacterium]|nr:hypothetical protein [Candidatus Limnocylindrales bacterium]